MKNHHANVIVADPPWKFRDTLPGPGRDAISHYKTLELSDIMRFPLPPLEPDAMLVLWRVASQPQEALDVVKAWGFTVKSEIVWVKTKPGTDAETDEDLEDETSKKMGMGHYVRNEHEVALVCSRGKFKVHDRGVRSTFRAPLGAHSEKPAKFFALVERLAGPDRAGHLVELFARKPRDGWHCYGDELPEGYVWTPRDRKLGDDPIAKLGEMTAQQAAAINRNSPGTVATVVNASTIELSGAITGVGNGAAATPMLGKVDVATIDPWKNAAALAALGEDDDAPFSSEIVITGPEHAGEIAPKAKRTRGPGKKNKRPGPQDAIPTLAPPPPSDRGPLPVHVVTELGQHPALTEEARRAAWVGKAAREHVLTAAEVANPAEAWILLQYRAPLGFFLGNPDDPPRVNGKPVEPALQAKDGLPGENIGQLCNGMAQAGVTIPITMLCAWSVTKRDVCRLWIAEGGKPLDMPDFVVDALAALAAVGPMQARPRCVTGWDRAASALRQWDTNGQPEEVHP